MFYLCVVCDLLIHQRQPILGILISDNYRMHFHRSVSENSVNALHSPPRGTA